MRDLAANVLEMARRRGIMIATAESCTGGMVSAALTDIPGSSDVFERGFITYSNDAKSDLLGVPADLICAHGAVSHEVALAMSAGAVARSKAGVAIALTGVAGPGGAEAKPEGLVWFGICHIGQPPYAEQRLFGAIGRDNVRRESVRVALELMSSALR